MQEDMLDINESDNNNRKHDKNFHHVDSANINFFNAIFGA